MAILRHNPSTNKPLLSPVVTYAYRHNKVFFVYSKLSLAVSNSKLVMENMAPKLLTILLCWIASMTNIP